MEKFKTILFDLDGTLIDHFNVIHTCLEHALRTLGKPVPTYREVKRAVGGAMENTIRQFTDPETVDEAVRIYREHFSKIFLDDIEVLPGVEWLIPELKAHGKQLAVYTNKQGPAARAICHHIGLSRHFDQVFGSLDTPYRKPDKAFSDHVFARLNATPETTCMVGDSPWDVATARAAGMTCYGVSSGTHSAGELHEAGADAVFSSFFELGESGFGLQPTPTISR